jgi:RNA polymerase sigma factor (sigma-70 family)
MFNPFSEKASAGGPSDETLIRDAVNGDRMAFEKLIRRHQEWIYNICFRMVGNFNDAADLTQETLIKIITSLGSFEGRSSFRTWAYRIVKNNAINWKVKNSKYKIRSFTEFGAALDKAPNQEISAGDPLEQEKTMLIKETKHRCMTGMLLCLDKHQRMVFILGELFGVNDAIGSEIMEISRANFRKILSRARKQLYNFMQEKCGLENKDNPCRCAKKTKAFIQAGIVDPGNLQFSRPYQRAIEKIAPVRQDQMEELIYQNYQTLFRKHPLLPAPEFAEQLQRIFSSERSMQIFHLKNEANGKHEGYSD